MLGVVQTTHVIIYHIYHVLFLMQSTHKFSRTENEPIFLNAPGTTDENWYLFIHGPIEKRKIRIERFIEIPLTHELTPIYIYWHFSMENKINFGIPGRLTIDEVIFFFNFSGSC